MSAPSAAGRHGSRIPMLFGVLAILVLGAVNLQALVVPIDISPLRSDLQSEPPLLSATPSPDAAGTGTAGLSSFPQTLARPIFRSDRRPADAEKPGAVDAIRPAAAPKRAAKLPDRLELVGIMMDSAGTGRALIRSGEAPNAEWVGVGHELGGWRLSRIEPGSILFEADGSQERISLYPANAQ